VITFLSKTQGLALSLAAVAGIIVSVGVTVDSYVVFFERLKDEVRAGAPAQQRAARLRRRLAHDRHRRPRVAHRRVRAVVPHRRVGAQLRLLPRPVHACDLVCRYFFTRPAVLLLARTEVDGHAAR
jgi:preprotein translocase subunit SecD